MVRRAFVAGVFLSFSLAARAADEGHCVEPVEAARPSSAWTLLRDSAGALLSYAGVTACRTYAINVIPAAEHREGDAAISADFAATQGVLYQAAETLESVGAMGGTCRLHWEVGSFRDLKGRLMALSRRCRGCVTSLNVDGHGSPGRSALVRGKSALLDIQNVGNLTIDESRTISGIFSANARIRFLGCSIGEGRRGRTFLAFVGQQMLGIRGGRVSAFKEETSVNPYATRFSELSVSWGGRLEYVQPPAGNGTPAMGTFVDRSPASGAWGLTD